MELPSGEVPGIRELRTRGAGRGPSPRRRRAQRAGALPWWLFLAAAAAGAAPGELGLMESVRLMLANDPNLALAESRLVAAQGSLLIQSGKFDPVVSGSLGRADTRTPLLDAPTERDTSTTLSVGMVQTLRSGLVLTPEVDLASTANNFGTTALLASPNPAATGNTATVAFTLRQPLLRGRGSRVAAAGEHAAEREQEAAALDLLHATAQRILVVADQYWATVAARRGLDILRSNEESSRQLLATTRRLIAADVTPAAEAVQLEANLAAAEAARLGGESALFKARQDLGREIGLDGARAGALPVPGDPFPAAAPAAALGAGAAAPFVAGALRRRADVQAARKRLEESDIQLVAAENGLLPQLDLVVAPAYSGLMGGGGVAAFFAPLASHVPGASSSVTLDLSLPLRRDAARGQLLQARAARQQGVASLEALVKSIGTDVPTAVDAVAHSEQQLARATQAVRLFEQAVTNQERKLAAGTSTVLDVITQRERLLAAEQAEVAAALALAQALAQLRFATGTIVTAAGGLEGVDGSRITTVPAAEEMER